MSHWIWRPLAWLVALAVASGIALWIYKKQSYKALSYQVVSISPLGPLQARGFADLRLLKGEKPIERPFLTTIRIVNTGDLSISTVDFATPLTIKPVGLGIFGASDGSKPGFISEGAVSFFKVPYKGLASFSPQVVDARVATTNPPKIPVELNIKGSELQIQPLLLNVGDELTVEILINGDVAGIEVGGRISGIKGIAEERLPTPGASDSRKIASDSFAGALVALVSGLLISFFGSIRLTSLKGDSKVEKRIPAQIIDVGVLLSGIATVFFVIRALWNTDIDAMSVVLALMLVFAGFAILISWLKIR